MADRLLVHRVSPSFPWRPCDGRINAKTDLLEHCPYRVIKTYEHAFAEIVPGTLRHGDKPDPPADEVTP